MKLRMKAANRIKVWWFQMKLRKWYLCQIEIRELGLDGRRHELYEKLKSFRGSDYPPLERISNKELVEFAKKRIASLGIHEEMDRNEEADWLECCVRRVLDYCK